MHCKLTLISAPAGFGKTTLVTDWLDSVRLDAINGIQAEKKIAWLSLDEGDNDPVRFLTYLVTALRQAEEGNISNWGEGMTVTVEIDRDRLPVTTLTGTFDQAGLHGLLHKLYSLGLPLISVICLELT